MEDSEGSDSKRVLLGRLRVEGRASSSREWESGGPWPV